MQSEVSSQCSSFKADGDSHGPAYKEFAFQPEELVEFASQPDECPVCMNDLEDPVKILRCGHFYCRRCLEQWSRTDVSCPICVKPFSKVKTRHVRVTNSLRRHECSIGGFSTASKTTTKYQAEWDSSESQDRRVKNKMRQLCEIEENVDLLRELQHELREDLAHEEYMEYYTEFGN